MEKSYRALRDKGTDLDHCENWQIKDFFEVSDSVLKRRTVIDPHSQRVGLKTSWDFDRSVAEKTRKDIQPDKYEELKPHDLF